MDVLGALDPVIAAGLEPFAAFGVSEQTLAAARSNMLTVLPELSDAVERTDHVVSADPEVIVRVHRPRGLVGALPALYSMHGGGYVIGTRDIDDFLFDQWCPALNCVAVSVEYRLAPETPYPGPLEDCYTGLAWTFVNAEMLGIDTSRVGLIGTSAGGGLAAALALLARDRGELRPAFQVLNCPMIDDRMTTPSSQLDGLPIWSKESNEFGWRSYLGELFENNAVPCHAAPARAVDLSGLPPAFVAVGGVDGFRDENVDYALRLMQAGVPTDLHVYAGLPHGHSLFPKAAGSQQWNRDQFDWVARQFAR
ncbi:MAG: alpha/beta hydrolase [Acidimicrobiia bacterium]